VDPVLLANYARVLEESGGDLRLAQVVLQRVAVLRCVEEKWRGPWAGTSSVAVCCIALQCVAACCSVLHCVAVCCSVLQCVVVCCIALQCVAVCCSVLQDSGGDLKLAWVML